ncbi:MULTISPECIES: hypothetical protein [unclassified Apibacter]|uniref:hypothetical protein n=1 Tax=unclassified Apibacter TaxID=2630820 RepID=UPI00135E32CF|nr:MULTISPECIES: hypothetical protein [unclassified Apibacter]MXP05635.1 hypothetical protein [Apibacter sp. B3546]MXP12328.1 hypothetical protein [Apibacter sp. B3239]
MGKHIFQTKEDKLLYNGTRILKALKVSYNSSTYNVTLFNAFDTKDVLIRQAKVQDFEVNGLTFNSFNELCEVLNEILFKKGGGRVSENNGTATSGTLEELRAGVSTTSVLWSPLVLSTWLKETINHQEEDPLKIYQEELLKK